MWGLPPIRPGQRCGREGVQNCWLLVYDNAERPDRLAALLPPGGGGQVLVTSRWSAWGQQATPLRVNVLARKETVAF